MRVSTSPRQVVRKSDLKSDLWTAAQVLLFLALIEALGCHAATEPAPLRPLQLVHNPYMDLCWPLVNGQCEQRDLSQAELTRVTTQSMNINLLGRPPCLRSDSGADPG